MFAGALLGGYLIKIVPAYFGYQVLTIFLLSGIVRALIAIVMAPAHRDSSLFIRDAAFFDPETRRIGTVIMGLVALVMAPRIHEVRQVKSITSSELFYSVILGRKD